MRRSKIPAPCTNLTVTLTSGALVAKAPMHVCIVVHQLGRGGVERVAAILANGFAERGIQTELLVCVEGGPADDVLKGLVGDQVAIRFFGKTSGHRPWDLIHAFTKVGRYLRVRKPQAILSAGNSVALFSVLLTRLYCRTNTFLFVKTTNPVLRPYQSALNRIFRRLWYTPVFRFSDGVLTLTDSESATLIGAFPYLREKLLTVSNPYVTDEHFVRNSSVPGAVEEGTRLIVAAGRLQRQKRFDVLLDAFATVRSLHDCRLAILGDGEDRQALMARAESLGIADRVDWPGFVSNVSAWLERADLFVLSSDYEGLPAVVLEALAHDCPVVSTDCFLGARELLDGAARCDVIPVRDRGAVASAIIKSLNDPASVSDLHRLADPYRIGPALDSHIQAMKELMQRHRNTDSP